MKLAVIFHPDCVLHVAPDHHPEAPARITTIQNALRAYPFKPAIQFYEAPLASLEQIKSVHTADYVNWINSISPANETIAIDEDTYMNPHTLQAALRAAGAVSFAVDLVMQKKAQAVFCNVRPPGHHAEAGRGMGFCIFNNVAVGVMHALQQYDLERVAIIDFDVHHGNGTQNIFRYDKRVMYCSSFQHPFYPGYDDEEMDSPHNLNVPLPAGTDSATFRAAVQDAWFEKLAAFSPQLIFFSAGFDGHEHDPLAEFNLIKEDYVWLTDQIAKIAAVHCDGRIISVLEGGYNLTVLAECVPAHVAALIAVNM